MKTLDQKNIMLVLKRPKDLEAEGSFSADIAGADTQQSEGGYHKDDYTNQHHFSTADHT